MTTDVSGFIEPGAMVSEEVGANTGLVCTPRGRTLLSAWCGRLDVWSLERKARTQSLAFPTEESDTPLEVDEGLLPPFAGDAPHERWPAHLLPIGDVRVAGDGSTVVVAAGANIHLFQLQGEGDELVRVGELATGNHLITSIALSPGGERIAATMADARVQVWDRAGQSLVEAHKCGAVPVRCAIDPGGSTIAVGDVLGGLWGWGLESGELEFQFEGHHAFVHFLGWTPSGWLISAGADGLVHGWQPRVPRRVIEGLGHGKLISDCCLLEGGSHLLTVSFDCHLALWSLERGTLAGWFREKTPIYRVCLVPGVAAAICATAQSLRLVDLSAALAAAPTDRLLIWPSQLSGASAATREYDALPPANYPVESPGSETPADPEPPKSALPPEAMEFEDEAPEYELTTRTASASLRVAQAREAEKQAEAAQAEPTESTEDSKRRQRLFAGVQHLIAVTDLLTALAAGLLIGGIALAAFVAGEERGQVATSLGAALSAALSGFAATAMALVIRRMRALKRAEGQE